jgi:dipeptidyl aminopeptidase/acylaminoacyl peptidase
VDTTSLLTYPIDAKRIGLRGHSYGGYMTMWAETQTQRFAAAVAGAGLSDWLSYYGLNDIDEWMIPFFEASVYDDPAVYAKSDPMHFVKAVKTPTPILVGDRDGEVPMEQSVE